MRTKIGIVNYCGVSWQSIAGILRLQKYAIKIIEIWGKLVDFQFFLLILGINPCF